MTETHTAYANPRFNYRATRYFVEHGWDDFINWFDERAWYPLGRIVGGTVYPGLMLTSGASLCWALFARILSVLHSHVLWVCALFPCRTFLLTSPFTPLLRPVSFPIRKEHSCPWRHGPAGVPD